MKINLKKSFFSDREFVIAESKNMKVTAFKYSMGIEALRVENKNGYFIILPFKGQQIWRANFCGKELTMKTKMDEPQNTAEYLQTYGGFLLHCGINAFGCPQSDDNHPQHGELPNVEYKKAYIEAADNYIAVGGSYDFDKSFVKNYTFSPKCTLFKDATTIKIDVEIENRRHSEMEYMYLCHINFRPINNAQLIYSGNLVKAYKSDNDTAILRRYMELVEQNPEIHEKIGNELECYDPEICFNVKYKGDKNNRAYTMQYTNEGACYVNHPVDTLPYAIRWISRSKDEDSMGMVLPATAEHLGYNHAKRNKQIKTIPPLGKINFTIEAGWIEKEKADKVKNHIENTKKND